MKRPALSILALVALFGLGILTGLRTTANPVYAEGIVVDWTGLVNTYGPAGSGLLAQEDLDYIAANSDEAGTIYTVQETPEVDVPWVVSWPEPDGCTIYYRVYNHSECNCITHVYNYPCDIWIYRDSRYTTKEKIKCCGPDCWVVDSWHIKADRCRERCDEKHSCP